MVQNSDKHWMLEAVKNHSRYDIKATFFTPELCFETTLHLYNLATRTWHFGSTCVFPP